MRGWLVCICTVLFCRARCVLCATVELGRAEVGFLDHGVLVDNGAGVGRVTCWSCGVSSSM